MASKEKGIFYPSEAFAFEKAILVSVNDASHAASFEEVKPGYVGGHRSQSGRLLVLASPDLLEKGEGMAHLLEWHSTTIRRVCRSTLQAETLSMQLGSEECEHVRQLLYYAKNNPDYGNPSKNYVKALDDMVCVWATDCRSLSDHLVNPGMTEASDKRLAIDLTSLRQEACRIVGESVGNPTYTDSLPTTRTTFIQWVSTACINGGRRTDKRDEADATQWDDGAWLVEIHIQCQNGSTPVKSLRVWNFMLHLLFPTAGADPMWLTATWIVAQATTAGVEKCQLEAVPAFKYIYVYIYIHVSSNGHGMVETHILMVETRNIFEAVWGDWNGQKQSVLIVEPVRVCNWANGWAKHSNTFEIAEFNAFT